MLYVSIKKRRTIGTSKKEAIPEFVRFDIVESDIRNVV